MKPNFLVIGAMKSGTTTLYDLLGQHPEVFMSDPKEPEFFCTHQFESKDWNWYQSLFKDASKEKAIGEGSTSYAKAPLFDGVPERVAQHMPDARLIYLVRHPLTRIESHWMHRLRHGDVRPFEQMVRENPNLLDTSRYWTQISAYREHFSDDQILVVFFEDLKHRPDEVARRCFGFLNVDPDAPLHKPDAKRHATPHALRRERPLLRTLRAHAGFRALARCTPPWVKRRLRAQLEVKVEGRPEWNPQTRRWVVESLRPEIEHFLSFYGKPRDYWKLD